MTWEHVYYTLFLCWFCPQNLQADKNNPWTLAWFPHHKPIDSWSWKILNMPQFGITFFFSLLPLGLIFLKRLRGSLRIKSVIRADFSRLQKKVPQSRPCHDFAVRATPSILPRMPTPTPDPLSDLRLDAIDVLLLVSLLAICLVVNNIIQKQSWPIPEAISTILVGSAVGGIYVAFPDVDRQLGSNCVKRYEFKKSKV